MTLLHKPYLPIFPLFVFIIYSIIIIIKKGFSSLLLLLELYTILQLDDNFFIFIDPWVQYWPVSKVESRIIAAWEFSTLDKPIIRESKAFRKIRISVDWYIAKFSIFVKMCVGKGTTVFYIYHGRCSIISIVFHELFLHLIKF